MTQLFTIKPLEWEWFEYTYKRGWRASLGRLRFEVWQWATAEEWVPQWYMLWPLMRSGVGCPSPEEGKQLTEAYWREFIKQALEPHDLRNQ